MGGRVPSQELEERVRETAARFRVPGVAVGVVHDGREQTAGFGITSVEHPLPVTPDTLFQIGSITKTLTGTAIMRLVDQDRLALDEPVRTYLPGFMLSSEATAARVTLRHLLTHTGGWLGDFFVDTGPGDDALEQAVDRLADLPQLTPLGTVWAYNNAGFYLAGRLIEIAAGATYEAAVQELVLRPLGLTRSCFFASDVITHRVVAGHVVSGATSSVARPWGLARAANPVGGLVSTVPDLLRYARFHLGDGVTESGVRLLSREGLGVMQTPQVPGESGDEWGLSWGLRRIGGAQIVRHGGATNGQMASLVMVPSRRFAIVVLTNANTGGALHEDVTGYALKRFLGLEEPEPQPLPMSAADLGPYLGRYESVLSDLTLRLVEGRLILEVTPKGGFPFKDSPPAPAPPLAAVAFTGPDRIEVLEGYMKGRRGEFLRHPDGRIAWLRSSRLHARRVP